MEEWLRSIGLVDRLTVFREQGIELAQLGDLTDEDLRELGLTIGERKRFRHALAGNGPAQLREAAPPPIAAQNPKGELRPLTVMFVDLVGSTSLGEELDPEDLLELIRIYREFCCQAINRLGGHVARFIGDGILAYFCYPVANENDPERAVRAALQIVAGISALETPATRSLQVRIGLATGRVVVSDLLSAGEADKETILGSCPNLAARLQSRADANEIIIAERTYDRIRSRFACESLGRVTLRGFNEPHMIWRVTGELPHLQPTEAGSQPAQAPRFCNRQDEMDLLGVLWRKAERGAGVSVLVSGEAGIGKSRFIEEFVTSHLPREAKVMRLAASAFWADSPLRPVIDHLQTIARIQAQDSPSAALDKLTKVFAGDDAERRQTASLVASLFGLPATDPAIEGLSPAELRERTMSTLTTQLLMIVGKVPHCIIVEDVHWLDPTSCELLESLIERLPGHPVLLVLTGREACVAVWSERVQAAIRLEPLDPGHVAEMMRAMIGRDVVDRLARKVADRTDGIPLFVEEVTRLLLQSAFQSADELFEAAGLIPSSLDESLMARLDRSGSAKAIAQAAAVVGRSARRDILAAVCEVEESELSGALNELVRTGILKRIIGSEPEAYIFHHALLRDAAYASLLRDQRRDLHSRVAQVVQALAPETGSLFPDVLAKHLTEAGRAQEAAPHWLEAARRSLSRSALTEATGMLRRGLAGLEKLPRTDETLRQRVELSALLGPALIGLKGPHAPETRALYLTAYELCQQLPEDVTHFPIYWGWWRLEPANLKRATALLDRAIRCDDTELLLQAHHCTWASHFHLGSLHQCREHMQAGLDIYHSGDFRHHARLYGNHDAKVCAHGSLSQIDWMEGKLKSALEEDTRSISWANHMDHLGSQLHAKGLTLLHHVYRRDYDEVLKRSEDLIAFTSDHGLADHGSAGGIFKGWVLANRSDPQAGLRLIEEGFARQREIATNEDFPVYLCVLAEVLTRLDRPDEAVERIRRERQDFEDCSLRIWVPELLRVLGDAMLAAEPNSIVPARQTFAEAAELASSQGAVMLGLRIAMSEARLDERLEDHGAATHRLAAALKAIPEPDDSADMKEARRLMRQLLKPHLN